MSWASRLPRAVVVVALGLVLGLAGGGTFGAFSSTTSNGGSSIASAPDWTAPTASGSVVQRNPGGYLAGSIRSSASYYVYAAVTDIGNPAAGVASVVADMSNVTTGQTNVALASGSWSVQGVTYNYRGGPLTANTGMPDGPRSYTLTMTDAAAPPNSGMATFSVTIDGTAPSGSNIQSANGGSTVSKAETNDTVTFTFSEQIDPNSILAGWTGTSTTVTFRLANASCAGSVDGFTIRNAANSATLPFGTTCTGRTDYVSTTRTFSGSTMVQSGTQIVITLGTPSGATLTAGGNGTMTWTPNAAALDAAGNACSTAVTTESGAGDPEF